MCLKRLVRVAKSHQLGHSHQSGKLKTLANINIHHTSRKVSVVNMYPLIEVKIKDYLSLRSAI